MKNTNYQLRDDISDELFKKYSNENVIAIDTELNGLKLYRDEICLIQICDDKKNVSLIKPSKKNLPPNLHRLLINKNIIKVFHFALTDVAFFKTSLNIDVTPFCCTKVMSKLIRTYTQNHGLKDLSLELLGNEIDKSQQQTDWSQSNLTNDQLIYAASDVIDLIHIYRKLNDMMIKRPPLSTGSTIIEINNKAQSMLPGMVELLVNGFGDKNGGWESSLFAH